MAEQAAGDGQIAVDFPEQRMTHEQLQAHAEAQHAKLAGHAAPASGMRGEHAAALDALLGRTRSSLKGVAGLNQHGVECVDMFDDQESNNTDAVDSLEQQLPKLT